MDWDSHRNDQMNLTTTTTSLNQRLRSRTTTYVVAINGMSKAAVRLGIFLNQDYNFLNNDTFSTLWGCSPPATGWAAEPAISPSQRAAEPGLLQQSGGIGV